MCNLLSAMFRTDGCGRPVFLFSCVVCRIAALQRQSRARAMPTCVGCAWCARCAATARATALGVCGTGLAARVEFPVAVVPAPLDARSASFVKRVDQSMSGTTIIGFRVVPTIVAAAAVATCCATGDNGYTVKHVSLLRNSVDGNAGCTFHTTGTARSQQQWQNCVTCGLVDGLGVCLSCAATCHVGHALGPVRASRFFCDCGSQGRCARLMSTSAGTCQ